MFATAFGVRTRFRGDTRDETGGASLLDFGGLPLPLLSGSSVVVAPFVDAAAGVLVAVAEDDLFFWLGELRLGLSVSPMPASTPMACTSADDDFRRVDNNLGVAAVAFVFTQAGQYHF
mmetsp:Transcript_15759/g.36179  ORF Transcript_15759/g.36179 Transcript_15759/m.36179 type:complete len:118 (+) Transcript_15759:2111-2464(+)